MEVTRVVIAGELAAASVLMALAGEGTPPSL